MKQARIVVFLKGGSALFGEWLQKPSESDISEAKEMVAKIVGRDVDFANMTLEDGNIGFIHPKEISYAIIEIK